MPHFIVEYTDNIEQQASLPALFEKVHSVLGDSGVFPLGGIRSRAIAPYPMCHPRIFTQPQAGQQKDRPDFVRVPSFGIFGCPALQQFHPLT